MPHIPIHDLKITLYIEAKYCWLIIISTLKSITLIEYLFLGGSQAVLIRTLDVSHKGLRFKSSQGNSKFLLFYIQGLVRLNSESEPPPDCSSRLKSFSCPNVIATGCFISYEKQIFLYEWQNPIMLEQERICLKVPPSPPAKIWPRYCNAQSKLLHYFYDSKVNIPCLQPNNLLNKNLS
jgi:hypothetical protein